MQKIKRAELASLSQSLNDGDAQAVRTQLRGVANVDVRLPPRKNRPARETPLMVAAEQGYPTIVRHLIARDANVNATNEYRQSPLLYAVRRSHIGIVNLLLKLGADPNQSMVDGDFVLREAAVSGVDVRISRSLIKHGADPCMVNKAGSTALHLAAFHGRLDVARILVRAGANVNHRDRDGHGPLTCAVLRNRKEVATLLLKQGANSSLQPETLGVAAWEGQIAFVKLLIEKGWDIHSKSHQGRTPLQHARNRKHKSVIRALIEAGGS